MHRVFVYGSLLSGFGNNRLLAGSTFLGAGLLPAGLYRMISLGAFPGLVPDHLGAPVAGEVYDVDNATLDRLDRLEGHPTFSRRVRSSEIVLGAGRVWVYALAGDRYDGCPDVPDNDWRAAAAAPAGKGA